jgi:hypothetical protein
MRIDQVDWGNEGSPLDGFSWHIRHDDLGAIFQWIGLREYLEERPIFNGNISGFV